MARRAGAKVLVGMLVIGLGTLVLSEIASARKRPGAATGMVSCSISSGTIELNPQPLPPSGPRTGRITIQGTSKPPNPCSGSVTLGNSTVAIQGFSFRGTGTATASSNGACHLGTSATPGYEVLLKWQSSPSIAPSTITFSGGTWSPPGPVDLPAPGGNLVSVTGSFGGSHSTARLELELADFPFCFNKIEVDHSTGGKMSADDFSEPPTTTTTTTTTTTLPPQTCGPNGCGTSKRP